MTQRPLLFFCIVLVLTAVFASNTVSKSSLPPNQCVFQKPRCGYCRRNINITVIARNRLLEPKFEHSVTIIAPQRPLLHFLEQASEQNGAFNFTATYYPRLGYFIDSINGRQGFKENKTFWHIIALDGVGSLECGATSFIPADKDTILFNFTTWAQAGFDY